MAHRNMHCGKLLAYLYASAQSLAKQPCVKFGYDGVATHEGLDVGGVLVGCPLLAELQ